MFLGIENDENILAGEALLTKHNFSLFIERRQTQLKRHFPCRSIEFQIYDADKCSLKGAHWHGMNRISSLLDLIQRM